MPEAGASSHRASGMDKVLVACRNGLAPAIGSGNYVQLYVDAPGQTPRQFWFGAVDVVAPAHSCDLHIGVVSCPMATLESSGRHRHRSGHSLTEVLRPLGSRYRPPVEVQIIRHARPVSARKLPFKSRDRYTRLAGGYGQKRSSAVSSVQRNLVRQSSKGGKHG